MSLLQEQKRSTSQDATPDYPQVQPTTDSTSNLPRSPPLTDPFTKPPTITQSSSTPVSAPQDRNPNILHWRNNLSSTCKRQSVYEASTNACLAAHAGRDLEPSDTEIESLISLYKETHTPHFPFVLIETGGLTGKEWILTKPVLGKTVLMAASYRNLPRQTRYDVELVREITERVMLKGEKTLELLQSILVFCAWYFYFYFLLLFSFILFLFLF